MCEVLFYGGGSLLSFEGSCITWIAFDARFKSIPFGPKGAKKASSLGKTRHLYMTKCQSNIGLALVA